MCAKVVPSARPGRLGNRVEELGLAGLGRSSVDEEDELLLARVAELEDRAALDDDHAAARDLVALGRLAKVDRQRAVEDDEDLLLTEVAVASALRARRVAPDVGAGLR